MLYVSDVEVFWVSQELPNLVGIIKMHILLLCFSIALVTLTSMTWICKRFCIKVAIMYSTPKTNQMFTVLFCTKNVQSLHVPNTQPNLLKQL